MFTLIFVTLYLLGWTVCGVAPWLAASVATRGRAGLEMLPLCVFAAMTAGLLVPFVLRDDGMGLFLSFVAAVAFATALMVARLLARSLPRGENNGGR